MYTYDLQDAILNYCNEQGINHSYNYIVRISDRLKYRFKGEIKLSTLHRNIDEEINTLAEESELQELFKRRYYASKEF